MLVTSQYEGSRVTGLFIGADNVRRYFRRGVSRIELRLDHLRIECGLTSHFWNGRPEIHDPRLCLWLELKQSHRKEPRMPMSLAMIPSGDHCFTLGPVKPDEQSENSRGFGDEEAPGFAPDEKEKTVLAN
jgi:hypothetical protein